MWFIFPQIAGLGQSPTARHYAIADLAEAAAYLDHPILGSRLAQCTDAVLEWADKRSAESIFGQTDSMKFRSSMTLFEAASDDPRRFAAALEQFYDGGRDEATLARV